MKYVLLVAAVDGVTKTVLVHTEVFEDDPIPASYFSTCQNPEKIGEVEVKGDQRVVNMMDTVYLNE